MKTIGIDQTSLDDCVRDAQQERILLTRGGVPVALVVGLEGFDAEQLELGSSDALWKLIAERRAQGTMSRAELERALSE
jgi:PHD/YefM family antitoxin component YafN of YafNO toxin-antitoxin module